jgi:hypothetical protein
MLTWKSVKKGLGLLSMLRLSILPCLFTFFYEEWVFWKTVYKVTASTCIECVECTLRYSSRMRLVPVSLIVLLKKKSNSSNFLLNHARDLFKRECFSFGFSSFTISK